MEEIISLAKFVLSDKIERIPSIWDYSPDGWQKTSRLIKGILEDKIQDDETAIAYLYGGEKAGNKYEKFKSRTKEQLYNTILFVRPEAFNEISKAYIFCNKNYIIASMLYGMGQKAPAMELLRKVFREAGKHGQHIMRMLSADLLQTNASMEGNKREYEYYREESATANRLYWQQKTLEVLYSDWIIHFARKAFPDGEIIEKCRLAYQHSKEMFAEDTSVKTALFYFLSKIAYLQMTGENESALKACDEYENYLSQRKDGFFQKYHAMVHLQRLDILLQMGEFHEAEQYASQAMGIFSSPGDNWFQAYKLYFLLCLNLNRIEKLEQLAASVSIRDYSPQQQDDFRLLIGYFFLQLKYEGKENTIKRLNKGREFRLSKLVNELESVNKDKSGYNISVLVLEAMCLVIDREAVQLLERSDIYRVYLYRHTKSPWQKRANLFLRILYKLAKCGMDDKEFLRTAAKEIHQLHSIKPQYVTNSALMEIISYDRLLDMILNVIRKQN
jgi:hypothetical protein